MTSANHVLVYSVVSDPFRFGFMIMARTLLAHNPNLSFTFRVLWHPEICPLQQEHRDWLASHVSNVEFCEVDLSTYDNMFRLRDETFRTPRRLWAAFLILEAFRDDSRESHVLCLDSDMICMGPLDPELLRPNGFAAALALRPNGSSRGCFNTGVMAIGPDCRGHERYLEMMNMRDTSHYHPSSGRADQALISLFYRPSNAITLPKRYNVTKRQVPKVGVREYLESIDTVFYHYVGAKPWHVSLEVKDRYDDESVAIWDEVVRKHLSDQEMLTYLESWRDSSRTIAKAKMDEELDRTALLQRLIKLQNDYRTFERDPRNALRGYLDNYMAPPLGKKRKKKLSRRQKWMRQLAKVGVKLIDATS